MFRCFGCKFIEDEYHMIYSCGLKKSYWQAATYLLDVNLSPTQIRQVLTYQKKADDRTMVHLGDILQALWDQHWICTIEQRPWNNTNTMRRLRKILWLKGENTYSEETIARYEEQLAR
jgi:hypothetical protein